MRRILLALALFAVSCGDTEHEFTTGACYFVFDNSVHQDPTLASAMNPMAPGIFCQVRRDVSSVSGLCFNPNAIPMRSKPLSISSSGIATCNTCKRQYDLNNNGFISSGDDGKRLTRYRATSTGPFGVLSVN